MAEKTFKFYAEAPVQVEWSPDGIEWVPVEHYDEQPADGCKQATVDVPSGWIRGRHIFGNPELYGTESNLLAVPEPAWVGLALGVMLLARWGRRGRAC